MSQFSHTDHIVDPCVKLIEFTDEPNVFVISENGKNVFHKDAVEFDVSRTIKKDLLNSLAALARALRTDGNRAFNDLAEKGLVRKIDRQVSVQTCDVWEIRSDAHAGRLFLVFITPDLIVVSAVNKSRYQQSNAINRGMKRWIHLLKNLEKKA